MICVQHVQWGREAKAGFPLVGDLASLDFFCSFQEDEV